MHQVLGNDMITGMGFIGTKTGGLYRMNGRRTVKKTDSGNPITLTDSVENKSLGMKLYGWSKQDGTPSPENPVEIESAGMKWSTGKNLINADEYYSQFKQSDGTYKGENTVINKIAIPLAHFVGKRIVISANIDFPSTIDTMQIRAAIGENNYYGDIVYPNTNKRSVLTVTVQTQNDNFWFTYSSGSGQVIISDIQIELGSTVTSYEPYTGGIPKLYGDKVELSVRGKNLFHITKESDCDKAYDNTTKRIILPGEYLIGLSSNNYHIAYNASIDLNTDSISFIYSGKSGYGVGIGTNCQKNKTYAFSFETNKGVAYAVFYSEDGTHKARVLISTYNVFFIPDYVEHVVILLTNNDGAVAGDTIWFKNVQIEEAKSVTAYEHYRTPQSTAIITPNGLPGIPVPSNTAGITYTDANGQAWIADEIDFARGKYIQRVWQAEFDGSEKRWVLYKQVQYSGFAIKVLPYEKMMRRYGLCTQYKTENLPTSNEAIWIGVNNDVLYVKNSRFYDESLDDKGLPNFKAHLAANPLVVMTYLDTPIERDLTSAELAEYTQLYSYKPTTVMENDSDCWMDVTYRGKK